MKTLFLTMLCILSLPAFAQTEFSKDDFVGGWRIEHYDNDNQTTSLTEVYFHESGVFYSRSLVRNGSKRNYSGTGGWWAYEDGKVRLDYSDRDDMPIETLYLQFENFSSTYLSFRSISANGEVEPALFEAHRYETSSFDEGC